MRDLNFSLAVYERLGFRTETYDDGYALRAVSGRIADGESDSQGSYETGLSTWSTYIGICAMNS